MAEQTMHEQLAEALTRLADLERRVADQDVELTALRTSAHAVPTTPTPVRADPTPATAPTARRTTEQPTAGGTAGIVAPDPDGRPDRRRVLRHAGVALAGAAGATVILEAAQASPAAATDNAALVVGQTNTATVETAIDFSGATLPSNMFLVANGPTAGVTGAAIAGVAAFESPASHGVYGLTDNENGAGVIGRGRGTGSVGVRAEGDRAAIRLIPSSGDPRTSVGTHDFGELYLDVQRNLWLCVTTGNPGTWRQIAGPSTTGALHLLDNPARVYDSRTGFDPTDVTKGLLGNGQERVIDAKHNGGVPDGSLAALINLTATNTNAGGWLAAFKNGIAFPGTSTLNWSATGTNIANGATVALDTQERFKVLCAGSCDFAVDVVGFYL